MKTALTLHAKRTLFFLKGILFFIILALSIQAKANVTIPLNDPNIYYDGIYNIIIDPNADSVIFNRFTSASYATGELSYPFYRQLENTQTGVRIRFKTASPHIYMQFSKRSDGFFVFSTLSNGFTVFVDGVEKSTYSSLAFTITHPNPGVSNVFEVTLPNLWSVNFQGLQLDDTYTLDDAGANTNPVYAAFGHSVPHGTGQYVSTAKTYPYKLSQCKGWNLYNFAVAGSTMDVGWQLALNIKGKSVDYITVDYGYNDWQAGRTLSTVKTAYEKLVDSIRKFQPTAKIYCIAPTTTTSTKTSPYTVGQLRSMISDYVLARQSTGDNNLHVIDGSQFTTTSMLAPGDAVHLSESGAAQFATSLCGIIDDENDVIPLAIKSSAEFSKSNLSVTKITSSEIIFNVSTAGNYSISIYSLDGRELYSADKIYFSEGRQITSWSSMGSNYSSTCIIKASNDFGFSSELKLIDK